MPTSDGGDLKLSVGLGTEKASKDAQQLDRALSKAFSSSDTKVKEYGYQLDKVTQKLEAQKLKVAEIGKQKIPTQEFEGLSKQIESTTKDLEKAINTVNALKESRKNVEVTPEYMKLSNERNDIRQQLQPLKKQYQDLSSQGFTEQNSMAMAEAAKQIQELEKRLEAVKNAQSQLRAEGKDVVPTQEYVQATQNVERLENKLNELNATSAEMQKNGTAYTLGKDTEAYRQASTEASALANKQKSLMDKIFGTKRSADALSNSLKKIGSAGSNMLSRVTGFFKKLRTDIDKTSNTHQKSFKKMLNTVLKYGFGIRSIFLLYRKLRAVISEGLGEMAKQFSDVEEDVYGLKNAWSGFKSGIVSAFQPIFAYVVPALVTLINYLTTAMNALANFFAMLTGQGYYYKAKKGTQSVAKGIEGTGKAADKANEKLAEYDDLIVIQQDKDSGGGGGGGAGDGSAWNWEKVDATASSLAEKLKGIWDVFKQAWQAKGQDVIDAFNYAVSSTKALLLDIADTFYRVFTDGYGFDWLVSCLGVLEQILLTIGDISTSFKNAWDKDNTGYNLIASFFEMLTAINNMCIQIGISFRNAWNSGLGEKIIGNILHTITNIQLTVKALADNFTKAWTTADVGDRIFTRILEIIQSITQLFEDLSESTKTWAESLDFTPALEAVETLLGKIRDFLKPILDFVKVIWNDYILPFLKQFIEKYAPHIIKIIGKVLDAIRPIIEAIKNLAHKLAPSLMDENDKLWTAMLTAVEMVADGLVVIGTVLGWLIDKFGDLAAWVKNNPIGQFFTALVSPIQATITAVSALAQVFNQIGPIFTTIIDFFKEEGKNIVKGIMEAFMDVTYIFNPIIAFFKLVWETIKKVFGISSPAKEMKPLGEYILKGIFEGFMGAVKTMLEAINTLKDIIVNGIKTTFADIKQKFTEWANYWKTFFQNLWQTLTSIFNGVANWFKQKFTEAWNNIKTAFSQVGTWFKARWNDIVNAFKSAGTWFKSTFTTAWNNIKNAFSTVGSYFSGVWNTIKSKFSSAATWFRTTFQNAWNAVKNVFSNWGSFFGGLWNTIKDKFSTIGTSISNAISSSIRSGVNGVISSMQNVINSGVRVINSAIRLANKLPGVNVGTISSVSLPRLAKGGVLDEATLAQLGEDGAEAVVPLEKNLGWLDKIATMITDKIADTELPLISQGNILPVSKAFMETATQAVDNSGITNLLEGILARLDNLESGNTVTSQSPIILELDGRTIAQVVWDEGEKRYKQLGVRYGY